jgi:hypothetical protein
MFLKKKSGWKTMVKETTVSEKIQGLGNCSQLPTLIKDYFAYFNKHKKNIK